MRMAALSVLFLSVFVFFVCKDQASQPADTKKVENTINSTVKPSDSELLKYEKEKDAKAAEDWKNALKTDKLENRERNTKK